MSESNERARWRMRDVVTGVERSGTFHLAGDADGLEFFWTEGNWSCDWNRSISFYSDEEWDTQGAFEDTERGLHDCLIGPGHTQRFVLLALEWLDGDTWRDALTPEPRRGRIEPTAGPPLYVQSVDPERGVITYGSKKP